jgi:membrane protein YdbS with pleckstrin-like domain
MNRSPNYCRPIVLRRHRLALFGALSILCMAVAASTLLALQLSNPWPWLGVGVAGWWSIPAALRYRTESITLHTDCLICRNGVLRVSETMAVRHRSIISIHQNLIGRLFGMGDVVIINGAHRVEIRHIAHIRALRSWYAQS